MNGAQMASQHFILTDVSDQGQGVQMKKNPVMKTLELLDCMLPSY